MDPFKSMWNPDFKCPCGYEESSESAKARTHCKYCGLPRKTEEEREWLHKLSYVVAVEIMGWKSKLLRGPIERPTELGAADEDKSFGLLRVWQDPDRGGWVLQGLIEPMFAESNNEAMTVIGLMYRQHHLSCRIAHASPEQVGAAFYTAAGAQKILEEKMNVKGMETCAGLPEAVCRAALTTLGIRRYDIEKRYKAIFEGRAKTSETAKSKKDKAPGV